eukprot:12904849-Prorocentrum_lima.AAC.1
MYPSHLPPPSPLPPCKGRGVSLSEAVAAKHTAKRKADVCHTRVAHVMAAPAAPNTVALRGLRSTGKW